MHLNRTGLPSLAALIVCLLLTTAPRPAPAQTLEQSDHGSFTINTLEAPGGNTTYKGVIVKIGNGDAAICFDTELMRMSVGWVRGEAAGERPDGWAGLIDPRNSTSFTAFHGGPPTVGIYVPKEPEKKPAKGEKLDPKEVEEAKKLAKLKEQEIRKASERMVRFATKQSPGWARGDDLNDPRPQSTYDGKLRLGPLPKDWAHWKGLSRHGDQVVFAYTVGTAEVLETPGLVGSGEFPAFARTVRVGKSDQAMTMVVCDVDGGVAEQSAPNLVRLTKESQGKRTVTVSSVVNVPAGATLSGENGRVLLKVPPHAEPVVFKVVVQAGAEDAPFLKPGAAEVTQIIDPVTLTKGGPAKWGEPIATKGTLAAGAKPDDAYVVDTLTAPEKNPWNAFTRFCGFDFFADGTRAAVSTIGGDVWIVSGIDGTLENLKWKRFATGLFQPLGLKVVDDKVYTIGRDGLTRLHDLNGDGEADYYENFNNDAKVTTNYHEFCLDLQTDAAGNFYYAKGSPWEPNVKSDDQGTMIRVSKDGSKFETFATGLRAPNGSAMGPGDVLTASDNQGHWMPSSKISWIRQGKFYGMVQAAHRPDKSKPTEFEQPLLWLPQGMDNSSGGQAFAPADGRWGPLSGHMVHLSYGKSTLFNVMTEQVDGVMQAAAVQFPLKFESSLMRARFNPKDGQLYVCGLKGWQTNAGREGALHRVRYTGKPTAMPVDFHAHKNGLAITFGVPLDKSAAGDADNWGVEQWNYQWTANYGSPEFSPKDPSKKVHDPVEVKSATVSADGKTVFLEIPALGPVNQMKVTCNIKDESGKVVKWDIYNTINKVGPERKP